MCIRRVAGGKRVSFREHALRFRSRLTHDRASDPILDRRHRQPGVAPLRRLFLCQHPRPKRATGLSPRANYQNALDPHSGGDYLLNFSSEENPEGVGQVFGARDARLTELKTKYDPTNFFSLNQNVVPMR
jgi:hypothetical protein